MQKTIEARSPSAKELYRIIQESGLEEFVGYPETDERLTWLMDYVRTSECLIGRNSFCIFDIDVKDPHAPGVGLCCYVTLSNDPEESKLLFKKLLQIAREKEQSWIGLGKRLAPYTYRNQYYILRK